MELGREELATAVEAAHHGADGDAELARGFAVRKLVEVDELEDGAEGLGERVELALRRRGESSAVGEPPAIVPAKVILGRAHPTHDGSS